MDTTIIIVRHAKSSWNFPELSDFDRPLNNRGNKDAPRMAERLKNHDIKPEFFISSPAKRALTTAKYFANTFGVKDNSIIQKENLYLASSRQIIEIILTINKKASPIIVFGHNPGVTDVVNSYTNLNLDNLPTCGVVAFRAPVLKDLGKSKGNVFYVDYPKKVQ